MIKALRGAYITAVVHFLSFDADKGSKLAF
jgi:hypothetical protein